MIGHQAKDWTMCASIDATGWIGEFIPTGLNGTSGIKL